MIKKRTKEDIKIYLDNILKSVSSMQSSTKHPKTSAHYRLIIYYVECINKKLESVKE